MRDRINAALKTAMKDKDQVRVSTLRLICAALNEREIASRGEDDADPLDKDAVMQILAKMVKQREDSARLYVEGARDDLAAREKAEIKIIKEFLPKPLSEDEVKEAVRAAIASTGAASLKDMGKVMGALKAEYTGRIDFGKAGAAVKEALA